jgi:hypothetical protein
MFGERVTKGVGQRERFRIVELIKARIKRYEQSRTNVGEVAQEMSELLTKESGKPVVVGKDALDRLLRAADISWPGKVGNYTKTDVKKRVTRLEQLVDHLYKSNGIDVPPPAE